MFGWFFGNGEPWPRGQLASLMVLSELGEPGCWGRVFDEPNLHKFDEPTVSGVDYPRIGLTQAWNDLDEGLLHLETYAATTAARGSATTFTVDQLPDPAAVRISADGSEFTDFRVTGEHSVELTTTVEQRTFTIRNRLPDRVPPPPGSALRWVRRRPSTPPMPAVAAAADGYVGWRGRPPAGVAAGRHEGRCRAADRRRRGSVGARCGECAGVRRGRRRRDLARDTGRGPVDRGGRRRPRIRGTAGHRPRGGGDPGPPPPVAVRCWSSRCLGARGPAARWLWGGGPGAQLSGPPRRKWPPRSRPMPRSVLNSPPPGPVNSGCSCWRTATASHATCTTT